MGNVVRSALGEQVDFDMLKKNSQVKTSKTYKTEEVRKRVAEVEEKRVRGFIPAAPEEQTPEEATTVTVVVEKPKKRNSSNNS